MHLAQKFDVFIFDWDGTINNLRTMMWLNESVKKAFGLWNTDSSLKDFKSMDYNLKRRVESEEEEKSKISSIFTEIFIALSRPKLHNDSTELLQQLRKKGKLIAIFSNARAHRLVKELSHLGVANYFDVVVSGREIGAMKPSPTGIRAILHSFRAKPESALYIGDAVEDVLTARLAGVASCAVADGFDSYHKLRSVNPDYIFTGIEGMMKAL